MSSKNDKWWVYIIRCKDNSLYTGITTDVVRRFAEHQEQGKKCAKYLRGRLPLKLVFTQLVGDKVAASSKEYAIKKLSKQQKELLIINN